MDDLIQAIKDFLTSISLFNHVHNGVDFPLVDKNANGIPYGGTAGQVYTSNGNSPPSFQTLSIPVKFGGTGADGALTVSSGTTTIALGGRAVVIKNYSSISITGTGNIAFSGANANGTKVVFLCSGVSTITTSSTHAIDLRGLGGAGSTGNNGNTSGGAVTVQPGSENTDDGVTIISTGKFGLGSTGTSGATANYGGGGASNYTVGTSGGGVSGNNGLHGIAVIGLPLYLVGAQPYLGIRGFCIAGAGGAGGNQGQGIGGNSFTQASNGIGGSFGSPNGGSGNANIGSATFNFGGSGGGGSGGGAFYMEVAGALNFTTGAIDCSGGVGGGGGNQTVGAGFGGSGGGGGSGGTMVIYYNSLTANSGSANVAGGIGGSGATGNTGNGQNGGNGGNGFSYIGFNQWFL